MSVEVLRAGVLTTVQDLGRYGMQRFGVPVSGAMDAYSLQVANRLVGNDADAAALEITLAGPQLAFHADHVVAVCGGDLSPTIGGRPVPMRRPVRISRGSQLVFGECVAGCRAYFAIAGGIDVPKVLGSRSTYVRAAIGGVNGRALKSGDRLVTAVADQRRLENLIDAATLARDGFAAPHWSVQVNPEKFVRQPQEIRFVAGRHWEALTAAGRSSFASENFRVGPASDRMGFRLEGARLEVSGVNDVERGSIASEAVAFGTIQLPPDGNPIVLMADRQTIGGYPRVGEVASVDLSLLAQLKPGDLLCFQRIALSEAQELMHLQQKALAQISEAVRARFRQ
jgi:antagonist of KipI